MNQIPSRPAEPGISSNLAGALAYVLLPISAGFFLVVEPKDRFVRFHAFQSMLLFLTAFAVGVGCWLLSWIPIVGFVFQVARILLGAALFFAWVFLMYRAFLGDEFQIPYLGPVAWRQAYGPPEGSE
jgi:uncharacterized membrane protein